MAIRISGAIWDVGPKNRSQCFALLAISDNCDDDGVAFPSLKTLARKCRSSQRSVIRAINELEADGWLEIDRHVIFGRGSKYRINTAKLDLLFAEFKGQKTHDNLSCDNSALPVLSHDTCQKELMTGDKTCIPPAPPIRKNRHGIVMESSAEKSETTTAKTKKQEPSPEEEITPEMVARSVMDQCGIAGLQLSVNITAVARSALHAGTDLRQLAAKMVAAWEEYQRVKSQLDYPSGAQKFFGEGIWRDKAAWRWKSDPGLQPRKIKSMQVTQ